MVFAPGIWVDGSCFGKVIPPLWARGFAVVTSHRGLDSREGDLATARTYLRRAGYASGRYSGPGILLVASSDDTGRKLAALEQATFERLGFKVTVRVFALPVAMGRFCSIPAAHVNVCASVGWPRDFPDGETVLAPTFGSASIQPSGTPNMSQLRAPAVDAGIARAATTASPAAGSSGKAAATSEATPTVPSNRPIRRRRGA